MIRLGRCIDLTALAAPNIIETGQGTGGWTTTSAASGKLTADFPEATNCGDGEESEPPESPASVKSTVKLNGCGRVKITCGGTSSRHMPVVNVRHRSTLPTNTAWVLRFVATADSVTSCEVGGFNVIIPSDADFITRMVACGDELEVTFAVPAYSRTAAISAWVQIEIKNDGDTE